ncbi:MAG: methyltransferase [Eubacteriales bacterium]|nr:methyltransferase [Eubacteriales bacterium]
MSEHYFTADPTSESRPADAQWVYGDLHMTFLTDAGVFSRGEIDRGSEVLLKALPPLCGRVLDLGCGYGFLGLALKKLYPEASFTLCDINRRALSLARQNAARAQVSVDIVESDGFSGVSGLYDHIVTNPPVKAGKALYYGWFDQARQYLTPGGTLTLVLLKKHGAPSAKTYLETLYPRVEVLEKSGGVHVIRAYMQEK